MSIDTLLTEKQEVVILFGPPCGGKGTVADELNKTGQFYLVSTGNLFRNMHKYDSALAEKVKPAFDGKMIDDEITIECLKVKLIRDAANDLYIPEKQVLVLDGFPRTVPQTDYVLKHFDIWKAIDVVAEEDVLWKRMFKRKKEQGRKDDNPVDFERRLNDYHRLSIPALQAFPPYLVRRMNTTALTEEQVRRKALATLGIPPQDSVSSDVQDIFAEASCMPSSGRTFNGKVPPQYDIAANHQGQVRPVYKSPNPE